MPRSFSSGLRARLLLLVFFAVLPAFALTWYTGWESRREQRAGVAASTVALARALANDQDRAIDGTRQILSELAQVPELRSGDPGRLRTSFVVLMKLYKGYASFMLLDPSGHIVVSNPVADRPINFSDRPWFQQAIASRGFAVGDFQVGHLTGKRVISCAWPVVDDGGHVVGVLSAGIDVTWLNQIAATAQLPPGAVLFLVDRRGVILARYPEAAGVPGRSLEEGALTAGMLQQAEGTIEVGDGDSGLIYAFTPLGDDVRTGLRLAVGVPRDVAYGPIDRAETKQLIALAIVMALSLGAAWFLAEHLVLRRAASLREAMRKMAAGDPAARTSLPYGHGELSELARAFDEMANALQAREEERAVAVLALQRSEERFRAFMDNSPALAFVKSADGQFVYANAMLERYFALKPGEWAGQRDERFWSSATVTRFRSEDDRVLESGQMTQWVDPVTLADGRVRHWLTVKFPVTSGGDGQRLAATLAFDLTEWRAVQEALARAEHRYTQLVDHASDGIVITDRELRLVAVNPAAASISGFSREELLGMRLDALIDAEDLAASPIRIDDVRAGKDVVMERRCVGKDGRRVFVEISARLFEDGGVQAIVRDVTARHEVERALRESEERFRLLYQFFPLAYQSLSGHGVLALVNDAWLTLTGYRRGQVIGRRFSEFLVPSSLPVYELEFRAAIATTDVHDIELTVLRADRTPVTVLLDGRRGCDEHGELRIHCALHDVTAAREADARLRQSEERYRTLFADSPISLWEEDFSGIRRHLDRLAALGVTDLDEHFRANPDELADCVESVRIVDLNLATLALYGAETRSQLLAGLDQIFGDEGREVFRHSIVALARGDRSWRSEGVNYTLNGEPIRLALQWSVAPGAERTWSRVLVSAMDITDRTRVETELRESQACFDRVFRLSPGIMGLSRLSDGVFLDVNDVFLRELGFRREEVIGHSAADLGLWLSPGDRGEMLALLREGGSFYFENVRLRRRSGAVFEGSFSAVTLQIGGEDCLLVQVADVTARRRAEEASRESQRMLATLLSNLPGMAYQCCVDPEWTMLFVSEGCRELTGYQPSDLIGNRTRSYGSLIVEEDRLPVWEGVRSAITVGEPYRLSYRIVRADGEVRWVWEQGRVAPALAEGPVTLEGFVSDITDRKRAEEELQRSTEQLRHAQKLEAVGRLAGGIAHDFNNLLTAILGYSDLILNRLPTGDPLTSRVEEIRRAGERAAGLTRKLLAFSRKQVLELRVLALDTVLEEMAPMLRRLIGEDVELRLRTGHAGNVKADATQIEQVVMNLVVNARDAMPDGGSVSIETGRRDVDARTAETRGVSAGTFAVFSVRDTGVGMDADTQARLFEPFFTTKSPGRGTGLGLPTVYGIVQQSGGFLTVESEPGKGSTFSVCLPLVAEPADDVVSATNLFDMASGSETLLVVEDEEAVRRLIKAILERLGYTVLEARDGEEAFEVWREQSRRIDLVVTDVVMPRLDGPSFVARVLASRPETPIIYLSGYSDDALVRRREHQLDPTMPFLQKPFTSGALVRLVRTVLDRQVT